MIWFLLQKIGFYIFLILTIKYVIQKRHESLLVLYFWGLTFANCFQFALTIWFPFKVVALGMLFSLITCPSKDRFKPPQMRKIISVLIFIIIVSDFMALIFPGSILNQINPFSRLLIQNFTYISATILLLYGTILKKDFLIRLFPKYCLAIEAAIIIGLIHYIFIKLGLEFAPLLRTDDKITEGSEVVVTFGGELITRIYGFAGEPKNLGFTIVPYLVMSFFMFFKGVYRKNYKYHLIFLVLGFFVVFQTYSSSALITLVLCVIVVAFFYKLKLKPKFIGLIILVSGIGLFSLLISNAADTTKNQEVSFLTSFYERTFGRAQNELENDRQETVIWNTFSEDQLKYQLFGYGIAQYTFHVPGQSSGGGLIPVQSGLVLTLVDFGVLGVIFYIGFGFTILFYLIKSKKKNDVLSSAFFILTLVTYVGSLIYGNLTTSFMFFMMAIFNFTNKNSFKNSLL